MRWPRCGLLSRPLARPTLPPKLQSAGRPGLPKGKLNAAKVCQAIGALLPANAIISDESQTSGVKLPICTAGAPRHDVLTLTGGAIGQGLPAALGAATASPGRPVLALVGDGSAMYTIQALWTIAAEGLNVTTVIFNNRSYGILNIELERVGGRENRLRGQGAVGPVGTSDRLRVDGPRHGCTGTTRCTSRGLQRRPEGRVRDAWPVLDRGDCAERVRRPETQSAAAYAERARQRPITRRKGDQEKDRTLSDRTGLKP